MRTLALSIVLFIAGLYSTAQIDTSLRSMNKKEIALYNIIIDARLKKNLPEIPLSNSLNKVAQCHVRDLNAYPPSNTCGLHSWSKNGPWEPVCYKSSKNLLKKFIFNIEAPQNIFVIKEDAGVVEFDKEPHDIAKFAIVLDENLRKLNSDYDAKRAYDLALLPLKLINVPKGTFHKWLQSRNKLGGQHKVPRLANHREFIEALLDHSQLRTTVKR